jgi:hypothetical protein
MQDEELVLAIPQNEVGRSRVQVHCQSKGQPVVDISGLSQVCAHSEFRVGGFGPPELVHLSHEHGLSPWFRIPQKRTRYPLMFKDTPHI